VGYGFISSDIAKLVSPRSCVFHSLTIVLMWTSLLYHAKLGNT